MSNDMYPQGRCNGYGVHCDGCDACRTPGTGTTASAAGTIRKPFPHPLRTREGGETFVYWLAEEGEKYVEAVAAALAEEARREAAERIAELEEKVRRYGICMNTAGVDELYAKIANLEAAQRKAGGDAEMLAALEKHAPAKYSTHVERTLFKAGWLECRKTVADRPVAEAAAQADDYVMAMWNEWYGFGDDAKTPQQQAIRHWTQQAFIAGASLHRPPTAPTAQPTPRPAANAGRNAAQPTPPDDELEAARAEWAENHGAESTPDTIKRIANLIHAIRIGGRPSEQLAYLRDWLEDERAALRQPGALPDEAEDAARLDWLQEKQATLTRLFDNSAYILSVAGRAVRTGVKVRDVIDAARVAAKQAGKEA